MHTPSRHSPRAVFAFLTMLIGCGTAPQGHWAPSEWSSEHVRVAKEAEIPETTKPEKQPPLPSNTVPVQKPAPSITAVVPSTAPTVENVPPPLPEQPIVDQAQLARERAKAAMLLVDNPSTGVRAAVCSARNLLLQIPDAHRNEPLVIDAEKRILSKGPAALREEQAEFEESRMYLCRDGTPSPSCFCNGPKRGCCSHHGGVAGCEPLPTQFLCP